MRYNMDMLESHPLTESVAWWRHEYDYEATRKCWRKPNKDKWRNLSNGRVYYRPKRKETK